MVNIMNCFHCLIILNFKLNIGEHNIFMREISKYVFAYLPFGLVVKKSNLSSIPFLNRIMSGI